MNLYEEGNSDDMKKDDGSGNIPKDNLQPKVSNPMKANEDFKISHPFSKMAGKDKEPALLFEDLVEEIRNLNIPLADHMTHLSHLASFPELSPMPVLELGINDDIQYINPAASAAFPDLLSKGIAHPFLSNWKALVKTLKKNKLSYITQDVKVGDVWYLQTIIFIRSNKNYRIYAREITERKLIEDSLLQKEKEINAILDSSPMLMILVDEERRIIRSNNVLASFSKRTAKEMEGMRVGEAFRCLNSMQDQKGCGFSLACENCSIRNTLSDTLVTKKIIIR